MGSCLIALHRHGLFQSDRNQSIESFMAFPVPAGLGQQKDLIFRSSERLLDTVVLEREYLPDISAPAHGLSVAPLLFMSEREISNTERRCKGMEVFGIRLVGMTAANGAKLLLMFSFISVILLLRFAINAILEFILRGRRNDRIQFWIHQGINLTTALFLLIGVLSIWFDDPTRLTTAMGLVTAGLAFALQKVVTSIAGYFVILRSRVFTVGDRILMAGVRGDVISLGFVQTTILEMGQAPGERPAEPAVWVKSRQSTGRIVTVTNDKIFQDPVFNYTRAFPYLWEEISIPIRYGDDRKRAEEIILEAARRHTIKIGELSLEALDRMQRNFHLPSTSLEPKVYYLLTDNWLELTVRFIVREHGIRELKDAISRDILSGFDEAGISIASTTMDIVGFPPLRRERLKTI
jgi:small-conductance mechanosensitive channel